ncbi:MAG: PAC2 family protein [Deltaproteobacteria bacterium]|nr:PAC2 family protein [Deltaproteobacteria bacterium]MBW2343102.1 PAC2 family protein [Deltaproteobacteria bacterium]
MTEKGIFIEKLPELKKPLLIAGFDGWGNALDVSRAMVAYMIRKLKAGHFASINPDLFYHYDKNRPSVNIEDGILKDISAPGGGFYYARTGSQGKDLVILNAIEPNLRWINFAEELLSLCEKLNVKTIITLGSMYDNVLHSDRIISGIVSNRDLFSRLRQKNVIPVNYRGPSAIHSTLYSESTKRGFECISLWCHCPYYLEGTTHFGLLASLGALLSSIGDFELDVEEIEASWKDLNRQIQGIIEKNPDFKDMINNLRKAKVRGSWASMKESIKKGDKVIPLKDFLKPG